MSDLESTILKFLEDGSYLQIGTIEADFQEIEPLELPEIDTQVREPIPLFGG